MDRPVAAHPDQRTANRSGGVLLHRDHRRRLHSAVHHAGRRRPDFRPDGADLRLCAGRRADCDIHGDAVPGVAAAPGACQRSRNLGGARAALDLHAGAALVAATTGRSRSRSGWSSSPSALSSARGSAANSCRRSRKAISGFARRCRRPYRWKPACRSSTRIRDILLRYPEVITVVSQHGRPDDGSDAAGFFNAEFFVPLKPFDQWPADMTKEKLIERIAGGIREGIRRHRLQFLAIHPGQCRGRPVGRQRRQLGQDHRPRSRDAWSRSRARRCAKWRKCRALPISARSGCSASPI